MFSRSKVDVGPNHLSIVEGREAILAHAPLLQALAERCGQPAAMHWLEYFLNKQTTQRKPPFLVLWLEPSHSANRLGPGDIRAAALFFEYRIFGWRTRAFSTDDSGGFRTVIARPEERARMAALAAQALVDRGAHIVLATYEASCREPRPAESFPGLLAGFRRREVGRFLPLGPSFDETLSRLGKLTRRNLRYYRRRLEQRTPCQFVADVRPHIHLKDLHAFNRRTINPVPTRELELRWCSACGLAGSFVVGLRAADGEWLSMVGGWRQGSTTVLHWQMNLAGHEQDSISTVMRAFFLEHEVERGARRLLMYGGTPHSIRHSFEQETIADIVVCRQSPRARMLRLLAHTVSSPAGITGRSNFLARTLIELPLQPSGIAPEPESATGTPAFGEPRVQL